MAHEHEDALELQHSWQAFNYACDSYTRRAGVSNAMLQIISLLYRHPRITQKEMCEMSLLPKQTVNKAVTTLLRKGLVDMKEVAEDRRAKVVSLTPLGRRHARHVVESLNELETKALSQFSDEQRKDFIEMIKAIMKTINAADAPAGLDL